MGVEDTPPDKLSPGEISVSPLNGNIEALEHQTLSIHYLPGAPMKFHEKLHIQVAHFEPDVVIITGAAVFPRIGFNVSQSMEGVMADIQNEARMNLGMSIAEEKDADVSVPLSEGDHNLCQATTKLQAEVERLMVKEFASDNAEKIFGVMKRSSKLRCIHLYIYTISIINITVDRKIFVVNKLS